MFYSTAKGQNPINYGLRKGKYNSNIKANNDVHMCFYIHGNELRGTTRRQLRGIKSNLNTHGPSSPNLGKPIVSPKSN
jgi:hypothetical protein